MFCLFWISLNWHIPKSGFKTLDYKGGKSEDFEDNCIHHFAVQGFHGVTLTVDMAEILVVDGGSFVIVCVKNNKKRG